MTPSFFVTDLITAVLLFAQLSIFYSTALLVLASGYLFTALIVIPHAGTSYSEICRETLCFLHLLTAAARAGRRTLASYIELVLEAHVESKRQEGKKPKTRS